MFTQLCFVISSNRLSDLIYNNEISNLNLNSNDFIKSRYQLEENFKIKRNKLLNKVYECSFDDFKFPNVCNNKFNSSTQSSVTNKPGFSLLQSEAILPNPGFKITDITSICKYFLIRLNLVTF